MKVETVTLGCRLNMAESETLARDAAPDTPWIVVNSCAVTAEAVRQTRQQIRRARRRRPDARILVTGCAAELDPGGFAAMPEVDRVVGNAGKMAAFGRPAPVPSGFRGRVRSFVAVQTGCDHRCTFCTIWQARGASRSQPAAAIRDAIEAELDRGALEIALTGVDITSYRDPAVGGLGGLCEYLLARIPRLRRLRLSSLDSIEIDEPLLALIAGESRLMPHFHLSLQSGDTMILKRMKRRHDRVQAVRLVEQIRASRADSTFGADLIAGFPTESEDMFDNTLRLLDDCDIVSAHIFPFSPRPSTPAERMPQVDPARVRERAARLRDAAARRRSRWLDGLIGSECDVLIENRERGHSAAFAPVAIAGSARGQQGRARIVGREGDGLKAHWA